MAGDGIFSMGLIGPLLLLFVGPVGIGLICSVVAIVMRLRADSEFSSGESQPQIDTSIALLAISTLLSVCALMPSRGAVFGAGTTLAIVGTFLLWPVSAVLAIRGRGVGRKVLLVGHGLIAAWLLVLVLSILIHES
jgi:hypothetical protein